MIRFDRRRVLGLLGGLAGASLPVASPRAQQRGWPAPYEQSGIAVEVRNAASGVAARDLAYRQARRRAWVRLRAALDQPEAGASDAEILEMVAAVIVEEEHVAPRRYRGSLTVRFDPEKVETIAGLLPPAPEEPVEEPAEEPDQGACRWSRSP